MARPKVLIQGHGVNDADYPVYNKDNTPMICPYYSRWRNVLIRCYNETYLKKKPTYVGTTVCEEWHLFSNFKSWMETQEWEGLHLDKDILVPGNQHYSPETCAFVPMYINGLLNTNNGYREEGLPVGVAYYKPKFRNRTWKYVVRICEGTGSKQRVLGFTLSTVQGHKMWQLAKADQIDVTIQRYIQEPSYNQDVVKGLYMRVSQLRNDAEQGFRTENL